MRLSTNGGQQAQSAWVAMALAGSILMPATAAQAGPHSGSRGELVGVQETVIFKAPRHGTAHVKVCVSKLAIVQPPSVVEVLARYPPGDMQDDLMVLSGSCNRAHHPLEAGQTVSVRLRRAAGKDTTDAKPTDTGRYSFGVRFGK